MTAIHKKGLPAWVEVAADDVAASKKFYEDLFGWTINKMDPTGQDPMNYHIITDAAGKTIGGLAGKMNPGQPNMWFTYFQSDNLDETNAKIKAGGGRTYMESMEMPGGHFTVASGVLDEPFGVVESDDAFESWRDTEGSLIWFELEGKGDGGKVREFYSDVFGTEYNEIPGANYWTFGDGKDEANQVGGIFATTDADFPEYLGGRSQWAITFQVSDVDVFAKKVESLGGLVDKVMKGSPWGDFAMVRDPQGAFFVGMNPAGM
jgi:predicted enzyme related to lactoylglutathione lyase